MSVMMMPFLPVNPLLTFAKHFKKVKFIRIIVQFRENM